MAARPHISIASSSFRSSNLLLGALAEEDLAFLEPRLELVTLPQGEVLVRQGDPIAYVYFPQSGVVTLGDVAADGSKLEVALVGREGMINAQFLLGCKQVPHEAFVQIGGEALRIAAHDLEALCARSPLAQGLFLRFIHALSVQATKTLASKVRDTVVKRLSRWLLMCHDRIDGDEINLIHQDIGRLLGVRRATITDTLHIMEGLGALRNTRARIVLRDRERLEQLAGGTYGLAEAEYRDLIGPFGKMGEMVPRDGVEPPTLRFSVACSTN